MITNIELPQDPTATPILPLTIDNLAQWLTSQPDATAAWCQHHGFAAQPGKYLAVPGDKGAVSSILFGLGKGGKMVGDFWSFGTLANDLPAGTYRIDADLDTVLANHAALAWAQGTYQFDRYLNERDVGNGIAKLCLPDTADSAAVKGAIKGGFLARDLINTPASDMGPEELAAATMDLAKEFDGTCEVTVSDDLLAANYPAIHAVGRASTRAPRLIDLRWGPEDGRRLTLVGKGVCFDTGGLNLKGTSGMAKMKKDMGGAATVLGLAAMIMSAEWHIRLRVLIPAVENAVSGNAYRPGDILSTRKGLTVEVGNTDAEGRIVLCDALAEADSEKPELIIDMATLTGAARVALGTDLPAVFTGSDEIAEALSSAGEKTDDPVWRLPLYRPYRALLKSKVADLNNVSDGAFGGAITAALYLQSFIEDSSRWVHIDTYGWNDKDRPGRPAGGDGLAMRALFAMLSDRFDQA